MFAATSADVSASLGQSESADVTKPIVSKAINSGSFITAVRGLWG